MSRATRDLANLSFSIDAERLHHAFRFTRTDESPPHPKYADSLTRVLVEPHPKEGVYMIGCDGGIMVIQFDPSGWASTPFCIGLKPSERALLRGDNIRRRTLSLEAEGEHLSIRTSGQRSSEFKSSDFKHGDTYPKWRDVLPKWSDLRPGMPGKLNAFYLGKLVAMANPGEASQKHFDMYCAQSGLNKEKAAIIFFPFNPNMLAVLMPMNNVVDEPHAAPVWLNPDFDPAEDL
jgi:hypothetical protein